MKRNPYAALDFGEAAFRNVVAAAVLFWFAYYVSRALIS